MTEKLPDLTEQRLRVLEELLAATVAAWEEAGAAMKIASDLAAEERHVWANLGEKKRALECLLGIDSDVLTELSATVGEEST